MKGHFAKSPPEAELDLAEKRRLLADVWDQIEIHDTSGATTRDVVEEMKLRVTDYLASGTPNDIVRAERLTAEALCKIAGSIYS